MAIQILLVDDDPFALRLLASQLAGLGFKDPASFERASDALASLNTQTAAVDLIFCDLQMPEMDGIEFVRHLAQMGCSAGLVLVSAEDDRILQTARKLALAHGLNLLGTLNKPVSAARLQQVMADHLAHIAASPRAARKSYGPEALETAILTGQLVNHYQPKVLMKSGALAGVETLVRWQHPQDGLVMPDQFIGLAEEHQLIDALTRAVLGNALRQARQWQDAGLYMHVAVNVSMDNLQSLDFPDMVARTAASAGANQTSLVLEVTESRLMKNAAAALDILTRLRLKRIGLSIDDFGTGYSSLAQLRDIPFDELKVDRGFVHGASRDSAMRAIFQASLGMAHEMGMTTVAEGVEDRNDWDFVCGSGCTLAQGYFIARPMPGADLMRWLEHWKSRSEELVEPRA